MTFSNMVRLSITLLRPDEDGTERVVGVLFATESSRNVEIADGVFMLVPEETGSTQGWGSALIQTPFVFRVEDRLTVNAEAIGAMTQVDIRYGYRRAFDFMTPR